MCCVTPGAEAVIEAGDLRPGLHLNMLGADGPGKAEATRRPWPPARCSATSGSRPRTAASSPGPSTPVLSTREQVTDLGAVLAGDAPGRPGPEAVTLFDSTGLAIQDLAVAGAAHRAWRAGGVEAQSVRL